MNAPHPTDQSRTWDQLRHRVLQLGVPFALYLTLACVATYPLVVEGLDHVRGLGTPPLNVWAMGWVQHQIVRAPWHLFDGNIFYPYAHTLAFSEHLFVPALLGAPVRLVSDNLVLTYNVVTLLTLALGGLGMYLLALHMTGHRGAAFAAGAFYAFNTWNLNELVRLQILSNQWFPFVVLSILRYYQRPTWRRATWAGVFYALQSLSCMYWALYLPLLIVPLLSVVQWRTRLPWRRLPPLLATLVLALLVTALFFIPYQINASQLGFSRDMPGAMPPQSYVAVMQGNWLYGGVLPIAGPNADACHFLGFVALALAAVGALSGRFRDGVPLGRASLIVCAGIGFLLSLGPEIRIGDHVAFAGPYRLLYDWMPGFGNVRYPERFALFVALGLAPLVAAGLARIPLGRTPWVGVMALPIVLEHLAVPLQLSPLASGRQIPEVQRWLANQNDIKVIAWVPSGRYLGERHDATTMYFSTVHWKRTVQGFTGYFPPLYNFLRWRLMHFPAPESVAFLEHLGVDAVIVRDGATGDCRARKWRRIDGPFSDGSCVVRLSPRVPWPARPVHEALREIDRARWRVVASRPGGTRAIDGDPDTVWTAGPEQRRGDIFRVRFPAPVSVARIRMDLPPPYEFPMHMRVIGYRANGTSVKIGFDETTVYDRLAQSLLRNPKDVAVSIDLPDVVVAALAIRIRKTDPFRLPWTMSELRVYSRSETRPMP